MHQSQSKSSVEIYDPTSKKWSPIDGMVTLRTRVGVAVNQRQVYAIGGFNGQDRLDLVEKFDYDTLKWTTVGASRAVAKKLTEKIFLFFFIFRFFFFSMVLNRKFLILRKIQKFRIFDYL